MTDMWLWNDREFAVFRKVQMQGEIKLRRDVMR